MREGNFAQAMQSYLAALEYLPEHRDIVLADIGILKHHRRSVVLARNDYMPRVVLYWNPKSVAADMKLQQQGGLQNECVYALCADSPFEGLGDKLFHLDTTAIEAFPENALNFVAAHPNASIEIAELNSDTLLIGVLYELLWSAEVRILNIERQPSDARHFLNLSEYFETRDITAVAISACFNLDHRILFLNSVGSPHYFFR